MVSQRAASVSTYDFDWTSHPHGYGFAMSGPERLDRGAMIEEIRHFLSQINPETGYLD